jgi:hypothetical protein
MNQGPRCVHLMEIHSFQKHISSPLVTEHMADLFQNLCSSLITDIINSAGEKFTGSRSGNDYANDDVDESMNPAPESNTDANTYPDDWTPADAREDSDASDKLTQGDNPDGDDKPDRDGTTDFIENPDSSIDPDGNDADDAPVLTTRKPMKKSTKKPAPIPKTRKPMKKSTNKPSKKNREKYKKKKERKKQWENQGMNTLSQRDNILVPVPVPVGHVPLITGPGMSPGKNNAPHEKDRIPCGRSRCCSGADYVDFCTCHYCERDPECCNPNRYPGWHSYSTFSIKAKPG